MKNPISLMLALFFSLITIVLLSQKCLFAETSSSTKNDLPPFSSVEERRILTKIQENQGDTDDEKKSASMREKELKTLSEAVDKKITELNQKLEELQGLQKNLKAMLSQKNAEELKRIKELAKIYEKMTPDKAALALSNVDEKLATELLANMKVKSAAKILNILDRKKASELSKSFSTVR
jgi:flagellar motility protein MotE (MotC chaperone)